MDPDMGLWTYEYDLNQNLVYMIDGNRNITVNEYDELGRLLLKKTQLAVWEEGANEPTYEDSSEVEMIYDTCGDDTNCIGRLHESVSYNANGDPEVIDTIVSYDPMGQIREQTRIVEGVDADDNGDTDVWSVSMTYDLAGKPVTTTYPDTTVIETTYHPGTALIDQVKDSTTGTVYAALKGYSPTGKIGEAYYGYLSDTDFVTKTMYTYDPDTTRLTDIQTVRLSDGETLQHNVYGYDKVDNITSVNRWLPPSARGTAPEPDPNSAWIQYYYAYDNLNRLVSETRGGPASLVPVHQLMRHDYSRTVAPTGNRGVPIHAPGTIEDMANVQSTDFVHDRNGNLVSMEKMQEFVTSGPKGSEFMAEGLWLAYNAENMPTEISRYTPDTGTSVTTFAYDAGGRRTIKRAAEYSGQTDTFYLSDAFEVKHDSGIYYYDKYIFAGNLRVAQVRTNLSGYEGVTYIHKDHLGSTTVVTDEYGDAPPYQPELTQYRPYGGPRAGSALNTITDYNFTDQEWDGSTGLYNYNARLYSPDIALFVTADSLIPEIYDPQKLNRYAYVRNNPVKYIDPSGHSDTTWDTVVNGGKALAPLTALVNPATVYAATKAIAIVTVALVATVAIAAVAPEGNVSCTGRCGSAQSNASFVRNMMHEGDGDDSSKASAGGASKVTTGNSKPSNATPGGKKPDKGGAKGEGEKKKPMPSPKFKTPTNSEQAPPADLPEGHSVRVMPPTEQYPNGYWVQTNATGQPVNPSTGKPPANVTRPEARAQTHVPLPAEQE